MADEPLIPKPGTGGGAVSWLLTLGALGALATVLASTKPPGHDAPSSAAAPEAVQITARGTLRVPSSGPFAAQLRRTTVATRRTTDAIVEATATVLATLPAGGPARPAMPWQFATGELLAVHAELLQAASDLAFQSSLRREVQRLHDAKLRTQTQLVERLRQLVQIGSEPARDLAAEEAKLVEERLAAERELHEVDNAIGAARRKEAALSRQLEQAGLPVELLRTTGRGRALLVADIPEARIDRVREGQRATARFLGRPGEPSTGVVAHVLPTIATAQRTLRAAIVLDNPAGALRPGMFANVGLGTDEREAIEVPASAVLHIGRFDYVLAASGSDSGSASASELSITPVSLGEVRGASIEIAAGLAAGATIISDGAILLKPAVVAALAPRDRAGARP